jgi:quercetin dioxygenase-like cupin family protein
MEKMFVQLDRLKKAELFPGFSAKIVHTPNTSISYVWVDKGAVLPVHHHPEEQVLNLIEGEMEVTIGDTSKLCKAGSVIVIPSNVKHTVTALTDCLAIDVFQPPRKDYYTFGVRV